MSWNKRQARNRRRKHNRAAFYFREMVKEAVTMAIAQGPITLPLAKGWTLPIVFKTGPHPMTITTASRDIV